MGNVIPFEYESQEFQVIKDKKGAPWFVAKGVCAILGLDDVRQAVEKLDEDEKLMGKIYLSGQMRDAWTINESGLYTLIIRSNKPEAKPFRRWVTHEVLPALRKTGTYAMPGAEGNSDPEMVRDAISRLNEGLAAVTDLVRALNAAHGGAGYPSPDNRPVTAFGPRPASMALLMQDESVRDFMESCCHVHPDASCKPMEIFGAYQAWCQEKAIFALGRNTFYRSVRAIAVRAIFTARAITDGNGGQTYARVAHGICLNRDGRYHAVTWEGGAA